MADILRIKRRASGAPGAPASLASAEIAYNEVDHTLYYGEGNSGGNATTIVAVAGQGLSYASNPVMNGTAAPGSATQWSRGDHVHPSDTTRAPLNSPVFTGTPQGPTPTASDNSTALATTAFVQTVTQISSTGLDAKMSVRAATTANITLSGTQTIDGVALITTERVLVKDQSTQSANGIYVVSAGAWSRATDMDTWTEVPSAYCFVEEGTTQADTGWVCTSNTGGTLNTTAITWTQFTGVGTLIAGNGLTKTANTIDAVGTAGRISVAADSIDIDSAYIGQTSINTLGTVTTGTWSANIITVGRGGTGASSLTGYVKGSGTNPLTASATIPNTDITGLGTMAVQNANAVSISGGAIDGITFDMGTF